LSKSKNVLVIYIKIFANLKFVMSSCINNELYDFGYQFKLDSDEDNKTILIIFIYFNYDPYKLHTNSVVIYWLCYYHLFNTK
jgi:hypothetical protein